MTKDKNNNSFVIDISIVNDAAQKFLKNLLEDFKNKKLDKIDTMRNLMCGGTLFVISFLYELCDHLKLDLKLTVEYFCEALQETIETTNQDINHDDRIRKISETH